ncbi:carnosine synthase 1-like [Lissotriton helveticus]
MEGIQKGLALRVEDVEGRARRNNLKFVGFPEGCEKGNMESFLTRWLKSWLPPDSLSRCFVIERAPRALIQKPPVGSRRRPVIAKLLNYHDRDTILRQARAKESLMCDNQKIMIFPDNTRLVQQQRQSFTAAKACLRDLKLPYALMYQSRTLFFDTPEEVFHWTDETVKMPQDQIPHQSPLVSKDMDQRNAQSLDLGSHNSMKSPCDKETCLDSIKTPEDIKDSPWTERWYSQLQASLRLAGLPLTMDRTKEPRTGFTLSEVTVCIMGSPSTCLSILLGGANLCPGSILLCLSPNWLSKIPSKLKPGENTLLLQKAVMFDLGGRSYLDNFDPPRRVTYFYTTSWSSHEKCLPGLVALTSDLECPSGGSESLSQLLHHKLVTRLLLDNVGVVVPPTLAFTYKQAHAASSHVRTVEVSQKEGEENLLQEEIQNFLQSQGMHSVQQVAVETTGPRWSERCTATFHPRCDLPGVLLSVKSLLQKLEEGESILLEAVCSPLPVVRAPAMETPAAFQRSSSQRFDLAVWICAVVCRSQGDRPQLSKVICSAGRADKPLIHQTSVPQTLETTLQLWGITDETQIKAIHQKVVDKAEDALRAVIEMEKSLSLEQRGGRRAQTDVIGVDFILTCVDQAITPVALGVNSHHCLSSCGVFETMNCLNVSAACAGEESASSLLIQTMVNRSQCYIMAGKEVLVVGAGGPNNKYIWETTREHGIKIHLIESDPNHFAASIVHNFIHYDMTDHKQDEAHAQWIVKMVRDRTMHLDGCVAFWHDCTILAALLCEQLGLRSNSVSAILLTKQKSCTHLSLLSCKDSAFSNTIASYALPSYQVKSHTDIEKVSSCVAYPCVMKLELGCGAIGVKLVENKEQCHQHYKNISSKMKEERDCPGIGLSYGNAMVLMEYASGSEHDVDIIIYDGQLMGAFVSDNGPTRVPNFTETAACLPTFLPPDKEAQLVMAAYQCCLSCGLVDGVFNVEFKMMPTGPKLIEINARMAGYFLRQWILEIYGEDIMLANLMVACSVPPLMPVRRARPRTHLVGILCVHPFHQQALRTSASLETLQALHERGVIRMTILLNRKASAEFVTPYCCVACVGQTREKACLQLISICRVLGIDTMEYPVPYFISEFK